MEETSKNNETDQLGIGAVSISALTEILKSDSVYRLLRYGVKSPSLSGMDDCEDDCYYDLYNLVCELRIMKNKYVRCFDKFRVELKEGDIVDVQMDGEHEIYKKEDGQLYFKPYGKEDRVSAYFSNDMIKVKG